MQYIRLVFPGHPWRSAMLRSLSPPCRWRAWLRTTRTTSTATPRPRVKGVKPSSVQAGSPYSKELRLLAHVFDTAPSGDPSAVCDAIERFGEDVLNPAGQWLKVAGRHKTTVLQKAMEGCPKGGSILEIGTYCGYSALRMAMAAPNCRVVSLEVDPAHMVIARNMVAYAGMAHMIDIWTGHSKDVLPRLPNKYGGRQKFKVCGVFMDQKGSRYHEDLSVMEQLGVLLPGAVVVADNVLKPGSPLFLWRLCKGEAYENHIVRVREFAMPSEDWMSVSVLRPEAAEQFQLEAVDVPVLERGKGHAPQGAWPAPPEELLQLQWESDRIRQQATRPGSGSVSFTEWASYAEEMKAKMARHGIVETADAEELEKGKELFGAGAALKKDPTENWDEIGAGAFSVRVGDDEIKSPISLRHSHARHFEEEITVPFPCSQPGCREFHDDCSGYCLVHRHFRIPWSIGASIWVFLQQLWLGFMFMILAVLELESKALSTVILLSLSPILCQSLATRIGGSALVWMCILVPVLWVGVGGTSARFNSMYRISTQHELTLEALCSQMLQFTCVVPDSAAPSSCGPASAAVAAQQALTLSTVFGCEDPGSFDELQQEEAAKDLRCNYLLARRRVRAFQREVCEPINAALGRDSSFYAGVRPELKTLFSAKDALAQHNNSRKLIDLLYCDVICEDFQEVRAVLQALKGRAQNDGPGRLQVHHVRDGFSRDFQDAEGRCGKIVVELDGYLATVRVYEASLHELREQMGRVHRLVHGFGFFQACVDFMDSDTPLRPLVEMRPPTWFQLLRACTGLMRLLALTTAAYFAMQYFVRYGPQAAKERLPKSLDSLLAWSDQHNQDVKALHQALGNTDDALAASLVPWTREGDGFNWLGGFVYAFPYVVHVVVFMQDLIRRPSFRTLTNAPLKRLKPMHTIYEKYFGVQGSLYTAKVALLQLWALPLQCFGKIGLLGSICTAGKFADEVRRQHEAHQGGQAGSERGVSDLLVTGYWIFVFFLGLNCIYPALLISFGEHRWASFLTAWSDAIVHLSYILIYLTMSLISLHKLHFKDTVIYVGNMTIQLSNELNPIFPFPTTLLGYISIYISLVHVCCVCRVLEDTAAQFALKSAEERGFERAVSSTSLLTPSLVSIAPLFQGVRKRTRFLTSFLYFMVMVGIVMWSMANQHGYPKQAMDTRCYPCLCSNGQMPGTLRLESCWLASTLRFKYLNLANRGISELEPRALHPLGEDLLILSLASNNLQNLPPGVFGGLRQARLLDLSHCMLRDLNRGHFEGLGRVGSLSLSGNHIRELPPDVFRPMPQLKQILLGGERRNVGDEELLVLGNLLSDLPPGIFKDLQWLVRVDLSQNRLSSLPRGVFEALPHLAQLELRDNLLQEIDSEIFIDLPSLANLSLENNVLRRIEPGAFSQVPSLRRLDLARNQLEGMLSVAAATGLGNLEHLNLSRNHLQGIESGALALLSSLQFLDLSGNELRNSTWAAVGLRNLTSLEVLCLAEVYLPTLPPLPTSLRRLDLQGSRLRNLSGSAFQGMKQLKTLQLQQNFLGPSLPPTLFRDLKELRTLKLGRNQLKDLEPEHFQGCENLDTLDLSENFLSNLTAGTFPSSLELLNLSFNFLEDLPPLAFAANLQLRWLHLRSAGLQKLQQDCFLNLTALQGLDLASNALLNVDAETFEDLEQLRFLDLSQNLLKRMQPETFGAMETLEWLDLAQNRLEAMTGGSSFGAQLAVLNLNASHLLNLDLSFNPLGWLPAGVFQGLESSLETLDLSHTNLTRPEATTMPLELPGLVLLNLSGNGLEELQPMDFSGLSSLETLDLSRNALGNGSMECGNLRFLSLAGNFFKEAPNLEGLQLELLDLQRNGLGNVSGLEGAEIQELLLQENHLTGNVEKLILGSSLRALNLARNRLQSVSLSSEEVAEGSNLEVLDLSENDLVEMEDAFFSSFGHLKVLNLSQNKLQRLTFPPGSLPELQILEVVGNRLERLPCGAGSPQVLDAKWNRLRDVSEVLPCLSKTRMLDLSYNQLRHVSLAPLSSLLALHLAMNQLPWLPQQLPSSLQIPVHAAEAASDNSSAESDKERWQDIMKPGVSLACFVGRTTILLCHADGAFGVQGVSLDEDCAIAFAVVEAQFSDLKLLSPDMLVPDTTLAHILGLFQPLLLDAVRVRARSADLVGKVARSIMQPT
eukprot:s735_g18.t2